MCYRRAGPDHSKLNEIRELSERALRNVEIAQNHLDANHPADWAAYYLRVALAHVEGVADALKCWANDLQRKEKA